MDKDLVNNQIVLMRKIVRNVKRLVKQKLHKQMKRLEIRLKKQIVKNNNKKLETKISNKRKEFMEINGVNVDEVSKQALIQNEKYFQDIIKSGESSPESKALARIAINENIAKVVNKFKEENPNCDQWLPSQIELWHQKRLIKRNKIMKKKGLNNNEDNIEDNEETNDKSNEEPKQVNLQIKQKKSPKTNEMHSKTSNSITTKKNVIKTPKITVKEETKAKNETKVSIMKVEESSEEKKSKPDPFFLSNDSNLDEEMTDDSEGEQKEIIPKKSFKNERFGTKEKKSKFSKTSPKNLNSIKKSFKPKKFENNNNNKGNSDSGEVLHPSWAAKRSAKNKINLNQKPLGKKIKFSDQ